MMNTNFKYIKIIVVAFVVVASLIVILDEIQYRLNLGDFSGFNEGEFDYELDYDDYSYSDETGNIFDVEGCNIAGITFRGELFTYYDFESQSFDDTSSAEDISFQLELAEKAENIKAIVLEIDSFGGSPIAAEEIVNTIKNFVTKPVIVQIREGGTSAAYWVATAGDIIFASTLSDVGGIGVTMSYTDQSIFNEKEGITFNELNSAKFKDYGHPNRPLSEEEEALFQRDLDIIHEAFVLAVSENREMDIAKVRALADGSSMLGEMAKENGLIDEIGGIYEVEEYIQAEFEIEPNICW